MQYLLRSTQSFTANETIVLFSWYLLTFNSYTWFPWRFPILPGGKTRCSVKIRRELLANRVYSRHSRFCHFHVKDSHFDLHLLSVYFLFSPQYLDRLFVKDTHLGQEHHALQVRLYAEHDRPRLLPFLRASNYYPLQAALEECQQRQLHPEMVFLLGTTAVPVQIFIIVWYLPMSQSLQGKGYILRFVLKENWYGFSVIGYFYSLYVYMRGTVYDTQKLTVIQRVTRKNSSIKSDLGLFNLFDLCFAGITYYLYFMN